LVGPKILAQNSPSRSGFEGPVVDRFRLLDLAVDQSGFISGDAIEMRIALNASGFLGFSKMPKRSPSRL